MLNVVRVVSEGDPRAVPKNLKMPSTESPIQDAVAHGLFPFSSASATRRSVIVKNAMLIAMAKSIATIMLFSKVLLPAAIDICPH